MLVEEAEKGFQAGPGLLLQAGNLDDKAVVAEAFDEGSTDAQGAATDRVEIIPTHMDHRGLDAVQLVAEEVDADDRHRRRDCHAVAHFADDIGLVGVLLAEIAAETHDVVRQLGLLDFDQNQLGIAVVEADPGAEIEAVDR